MMIPLPVQPASSRSIEMAKSSGMKPGTNTGNSGGNHRVRWFCPLGLEIGFQPGQTVEAKRVNSEFDTGDRIAGGSHE